MNAMTHYNLHSNSDGSISGWAFTNDDHDDGSCDSSAEWRVHYPTYKAMMERTGGSHFGCICEVIVTLDGKRVEAPKAVLS